MDNDRTKGHIFALITVFIWGTTFISTKTLLKDFSPVEILFFRFVMGLLLLTAACPKRLRIGDKRRELTFVLAGLTGVCLYYLMENVALTYTTASNVGVIVATAPFFTAILSGEAKRSNYLFFIGFALSMAGICLISFTSAGPGFNPLGDILALTAAFMWACYSVLLKKISLYGYNTIQTTRRIFVYGILFMIPAVFASHTSLGLSRFADMTNLLNILFLGAGASALCFVTWNVSVKILGALKTSVYIYMVPVVTVIASAIILGERMTPASVLGTALTLSGLVLSQKRARRSSVEAA